MHIAMDLTHLTLIVPFECICTDFKEFPQMIKRWKERTSYTLKRLESIYKNSNGNMIKVIIS